MKTTVLYIVNALLVAAVVVLFVLFAKQDKQPAVSAVTQDGISVAFVRMDSLLLNYNVYKQMSEELLKQEESARATLNQKATDLQRDMEDFQKKLENRAFLSEERARSEQERILKKQRDLQELNAKMEQDLMVKQKQMNDRLALTIDSVVKEYNQEKGYAFILSTAGTDNILYGDNALNVTDEILSILNAN
ncbi:MAG: OmpH family outer membrane protein [Paludibacteraceae bacterium]|jgi:outer membrane protein|nr:OmpH family outer membrane protein [Paludibacteraceae bacterium]